MRVLQHVVESADEVVDLLLAADERGQQLDDVDVVGGHLGEDSMAMEEGHHHHLAEDGGPQMLEGVEAPAQGLRLRGPELQPDHQSLASDLVEHLVALDQGGQRRLEGKSVLVGPTDDVLFVEGGQSGQAGHHGQLVPSKGGRVLQRLLERAVDRREDTVGHEDGAHGDEAPGQGLGHRDDVRLEVPVLEAEELPGSPESGLHLIEHEERSVRSAELLSLSPVLRRGHVDALALDGLDDEGGDVAVLQRTAQGLEVAEGYGLGAGEELTEALTEFGPTVEREGARGQPVERVLGEENAGPLGGLAGELDG